MRKDRKPTALPIPVNRALTKLGKDLQTARKRRRISMALMAERADISRITLGKIEKGDPGVSIGSYVTVLFILGMIDELSELADLKNDEMGQFLEEENLPQRIRSPRATKKPKRTKK